MTCGGGAVVVVVAGVCSSPLPPVLVSAAGCFSCFYRVSVIVRTKEGVD